MARSRRHAPARRPPRSAPVDGPVAPPAPGDVRAAALPPPRLETALYLLAGLLALAVRLGGLDLAPLAPREAALAVGAWQLSRGEAAPVAAAPLLLHLNAFLFFLVGPSDAAARLLPALAGAALCLGPWALRHRLGRSEALASSFLLALSPTLVQVSRTVESLPLALLAGLLLVVGLDATVRAQGWGYGLTALALGVLLVAGPAGYFVLVPMGVAALGLALTAPATRRTVVALWRQAAPARPALLWALLFVFLVATRAFTYPFGLQEALLDPLALFVEAFVPRTAGAPIWLPMLTVAVYEPLLLAGALLAAGRRWREWRGRFFLIWAGVALLLCLAEAERRPALTATIIVPLALLAGLVVGPAVGRLRDARLRRECARLLLFGGPPLVLLGIVAGYLSLPAPRPRPPDPAVDLIAPALLPALILFLVFIAGHWADRRAVWGGRAALGLVGVGLGVLWQVHSLSQLAFIQAQTPVELFRLEATASDVRTLAGEVREILAVLENNRIRDREVVVRGPGAVLVQWYLSGRPVRPASDGEALVVVLPAGAPAPGEGYLGQRYHLWQAWRPHWPTLGAFYRWLVYRELPAGPGATPVERTDVIVYVRSLLER